MKTQKVMPFIILVIVIFSSTLSCNQSAATPTTTPTATAIPTIEPVDSNCELVIDGLSRSYLLHIPPGMNKQQLVPLVFAFHGYTLNPFNMKVRTGFNELANIEGFIVVYPEGLGSSWNTGEEALGPASNLNVDESAFIHEILSELEAIAPVDPDRIYAAGFSMGGSLVYRLGCEMSETFAAIASVAGPMEYHNCQPQQAVSVIHIHGSKDNLVRFNGGGEYGTSPVKYGIDTWVALNECKEGSLGDINGTKYYTYKPCQDGTGVELYKIKDGKHSWFDNGISATEIIWDFFETHPKQ